MQTVTPMSLPLPMVFQGFVPADLVEVGGDAALKLCQLTTNDIIVKDHYSHLEEFDSYIILHAVLLLHPADEGLAVLPVQ